MKNVVSFQRARRERHPGKPTSTAAQAVGAAAWAAESRRQVAVAVERAEALGADRLARAAMALDGLMATGSYSASVLAHWFASIADRFGTDSSGSAPAATARLVVAALFEALVDAGDTEAELDVSGLSSFIHGATGIRIEPDTVADMLGEWGLDVVDLGSGLIGVSVPASGQT